MYNLEVAIKSPQDIRIEQLQEEIKVLKKQNELLKHKLINVKTNVNQLVNRLNHLNQMVGE